MKGYNQNQNFPHIKSERNLRHNAQPAIFLTRLKRIRHMQLTEQWLNKLYKIRKMNMI